MRGKAKTWKVPVSQMLDLAGNKLNKYGERKRMSNGTHVGLILIKTHSITKCGPMSNVHISKSNNWHGRLVEGARRRPQAHAFRSAVVSRPRLSSALGCEGGNGGPRIG